MVVQRSGDWRSALVAAHPALFQQEFDGRIVTPGLPQVDDGWRDLVETAVGRIAAAVAGSPGGWLRIGQIKSKFGTLRLYHFQEGLSAEAVAAVEEAVELAQARSGCTCETCGAEGRLFRDAGWYLTACEAHRRGDPVRMRPSQERLFVVRRYRGGESTVTYRHYDRDVDRFIAVDPSTVDPTEE